MDDKPITNGGIALSRRERKKKETRSRILSAALSLIKDHGYDKVKIEEIARRADVANATFFLHFPNKAALITAFNEEVSEKIIDRLAEFDLPPADQLELLRAIVLDEWSRHADLLRQIVSDQIARGGEDLDRSMASIVDIAEDIVRTGQAQGAFSGAYDPAVVAQSLIASWRASTRQWARHGDDDQARLANRQVLDLILNGLTPR